MQCDETKPGCTNCKTFKIHCDFDPRPPPVIIEPDSSPTNSCRRRRGRPRKGWDLRSNPSTATSTANSPAAESESAMSGVELLSRLNVSDLELMHQYSTSTFHELGGGAIGTMWRINVPRIGFSEHCVLHNAMALSAMHLAYLHPDRRDHYAALGAHHSTIGLQKTSDILMNLTQDNCRAVYVSAVLVCLYVFAKGPSPGDFLVFSQQGPSEWFPLLKGVRSIVEIFGAEVLYTGPLAPMSNGPRKASQAATAKENKPRIDWEQRFEELRQFVSLSGDPDSAISMGALEGLAACYEGVFGKGPDASYNGDTANQVHLGWLYRMEQPFVQCLHQHHPLALIVLAHFSPLLKSMEPLWFMEGWAKHLITGVHGFVDQTYWSWLQWPLEQVELYSVIQPSSSIQTP